ncbi:MAG: ABC transporter permease [Chloroflexota bacterium]
MRKIWAITWKDVYQTFTDQSLLLIMLVTPLVLSTIIALAFSNLINGGSGLSDIPVVIVNQDAGQNGAIFVSILAPDQAPEDAGPAAFDDCPSVAVGTNGSAETTDNANGQEENDQLLALTETDVMNDPAVARAAVDDGQYAAAVIIPPEFSERITFSQNNMQINPVPVEVYGDSSRPISANVIRSVTESITNQILAGNIAIAANLNVMFAEGLQQQAVQIDDCVFASAFNPENALINIDRQALTEEAQPDNPLVLFGSALAAFFALFTASGGASSILEERRNWTLQRMVISPTPRHYILFGKLLAVFATVLLQLLFLYLALTLVASLLESEFAFIWGTNWLAIVGLLLATALAASGVGMVAAAVARTAEQANIIGSVIALLMGLLGGAFFNIGQLPEEFDAVTRVSIVRWGQEGFTKLAAGQTDILINLVALTVIGGVLFLFSLFMFIRRSDV